MCFGSRPAWEEDVEFANRRRRRPRTRVVTETIIRKRESPPAPAPPPPPPPPAPVPEPEPKPIEPPPAPATPAPEPPKPQVELISVEEEVKQHKPTVKKSRHGSRGADEVYIERERERVRLSPPVPDYETYRYVEGPTSHRHAEEDRMERRRSRSITYESNPRMSGRIHERERVLIEDGGRRREYYRRP